MQQRLIDIGNWLATNGEAIYGTESWKEPAQWSAGKLPQKEDKSFMAGYDVAQLVKPKQDQAHIEYFFTRKGRDLYCIVPAYTSKVVIHDLKVQGSTKATVLGSNKTFKCKSSGKDCVIDLSEAHPGEIPNESFVVKLSDVVK
jgi:alpha-L-fucosidase